MGTFGFTTIAESGTDGEDSIPLTDQAPGSALLSMVFDQEFADFSGSPSILTERGLKNIPLRRKPVAVKATSLQKQALLGRIEARRSRGRYDDVIGKPVSFADVSDSLDFFHETDGGEGVSGVAWFDYNNDGYLDVFLTNGIGHRNGLFENNRDGRFRDVSAGAGIENGLGNSGVIAGDIDNDGWVDLFLTGEGAVVSGAEQSPTRLYHNDGNGRFTDITAQAGVPGAETTWTAAFGDIDNDGFLDLFATAPGSQSNKVSHRNKLYRNNGDLTFTDISASAGVDSRRSTVDGSTVDTDLGTCIATFSDYDNDGDVDLFIGNCNDLQFRPAPVELWRNDGDLTFTDVTLEAGHTAARTPPRGVDGIRGG